MTTLGVIGAGIMGSYGANALAAFADKVKVYDYNFKKFQNPKIASQRSVEDTVFEQISFCSASRLKTWHQ